MNKLKISNLRVSYRSTDSVNGNANKDRNPVLEEYSLTVNKKELVVILGPSGCGKSTLLSAISGLKQPDDGEISFGDTCFFNKADRINVQAEERNIGFVFQTYALWPHMTVYQNIAFPLRSRKMAKKQIKSRVADMLETVHMRGYGHRYPGSLSGGERQRIALVRSLVYQPSLLLLDEPLANLDANLKESLIREIKEIQRKLGVTAIYVTHDQSEAFEIADRIVIMNEGKIMQQGTPQEIYNDSQNLFVADFIGKNNIFDNSRGAFPSFLARHCHCKAPKAVAVRPEDIELSDDGAHRGVIEKVIFKGDRTEYVILCSGGVHLTTFAPGNAVHVVGDSVRFEVKRCQIL